MLKNDGIIQIGPSDRTLSAASTVEAASVANIVGTAYGTIDLYGSSTAQATLDVASPAGFGAAGTLYGTIVLSRHALIEFASGQITTIAANSSLSLIGPSARVADASKPGSNSALTGLDTVKGGLALENGATVTTSGPLTNRGAISLDSRGSLLDIKGALTNSGTLQIGSGFGTISAASTVEAASIANVDGTAYGTIDLYGWSTAQATLDVASPAGFGAAGILYGTVNLSTNALIEFKSGQITTIAANSALSLSGSQVFVADASDTSSNSALKGLKTVTGALDLSDGATLATSSGVTVTGDLKFDNATLTTSGALTNSGAITLDSDVQNGGSLLKVNGAFTNSGTLQIGANWDNWLLPASTVQAASVANVDGTAYGTIDLYGSSGRQPTLDIASAAGFGVAGTLYGTVNLSANALIEFKSGQITTIAANSALKFERLPGLRRRRVGHELEQRAEGAQDRDGRP